MGRTERWTSSRSIHRVARRSPNVAGGDGTALYDDNLMGEAVVRSTLPSHTMLFEE